MDRKSSLFGRKVAQAMSALEARMGTRLKSDEQRVNRRRSVAIFAAGTVRCTAPVRGVSGGRRMMEGLGELLLGSHASTLRMANEELDAHFSGLRHCDAAAHVFSIRIGLFSVSSKARCWRRYGLGGTKSVSRRSWSCWAVSSTAAWSYKTCSCRAAWSCRAAARTTQMQRAASTHRSIYRHGCARLRGGARLEHPGRPFVCLPGGRVRRVCCVLCDENGHSKNDGDLAWVGVRMQGFGIERHEKVRYFELGLLT